MATMTLEQLEQYVVELKPQEQLRLVARISERLSAIFMPKTTNTRQQRKKEVDRLLALCDEAAEMWDGPFDAVSDIHHLRSYLF